MEPTNVPDLSPGDRVLLEQQGVLTPAQSKTVLWCAFDVPEGLECLSVFLDYRPRWSRDPERNERLITRAVDRQLQQAAGDGVALPLDVRQQVLARLRPQCSGLRNLLNLVLVSPSGEHRGRWDLEQHGAPAPDLVASTWATPGYVPGPISPGTWSAALEVHEVIGDSCDYHLRLAGLTRAPEPLPARAHRSCPAPVREYGHPVPEGWLRGELHCHSRASDGLFDTTTLVERARELGLDFVALTDHNVAVRLKDIDRLPLTVIPGCEITTFRGHFLAYGVSEAPAWYERERLVEPRELAAFVRARGGLFGLAHPFVLGDPICVGCRLGVDVDPDELDVLEVWSRGAEEIVAVRHALRLFDRLCRQGHRVVAVAGRDWHGPAHEQGTAGRRFPATVVRSRADRSALLQALRQGACYLSVGPVVDLRLQGATRTAGLGQRLGIDVDEAGGGQEVTAQIRVDNLEEPACLRLLCAGEVVRIERVPAGPFRREYPGIRPRRGGVRLELWGEDLAEPLVITNRIEFRGFIPRAVATSRSAPAGARGRAADSSRSTPSGVRGPARARRPAGARGTEF